MPRRTLAERFADLSTRASNGCLEWQGSRKPSGYGQLYDPRTKNQAAAHRIAWELARGPIPSGMWVLHRCDNPCCVDVEHLFLGTQQDNVDDMVAKGRASKGPGVRRFGEKNGSHRLSDAQVWAIRSCAASGAATNRQIALAFGVSSSTVCCIVRGLARPDRSVDDS